MKKRLLPFAALVMLFTACTQEHDAPPSADYQALSIEQARAVFGQESQLTRAGATNPVLPTIDEALWSQSTLNSFQYAAAVTTPILTAGTLSATVWDMPVEVTQKIVVLNGTGFDRPRAYIQTYIPTYRNQLEYGDISADVTHFGDRPSFAGWIFTHDLDGGLIALEFWRAGVIQDYIIIERMTPENRDIVLENITRMMQGLKLYNQSATTRTIENTIWIEEVVIIGYRNTYAYDSYNFNKNWERDGRLLFGDLSVLLGGGGGGGGEPEEPAEPNLPVPEPNHNQKMALIGFLQSLKPSSGDVVSVRAFAPNWTEGVKETYTSAQFAHYALRFGGVDFYFQSVSYWIFPCTKVTRIPHRYMETEIYINGVLTPCDLYKWSHSSACGHNSNTVGTIVITIPSSQRFQFEKLWE